MNIKWIKLLATVLALVPAGVIVATLFGPDTPADPVEYLQDETGLWALRLLLITLAMSPLQAVTRWRWPVLVRRNLGVVTFIYACIHAASFFVFDQLLDLNLIFKEMVGRPFILLGVLSWLLLIPMALTSNNISLRRLGPGRWRKIHRLIYLVAILVCLHFIMLVKVDLTSPLVYSAVGLCLLGWRVWRFRSRKRLAEKRQANGRLPTA